ncbi:MAG TPA: MoaD/ThiS family protein [Rhodanobacteraceae bacterium]|nr:MoaD/ThiS family protein [Rhodanobacteraceae bacterium]
MKIRLLYFASLADRAGRTEEIRDTVATNPRDLYAEIAREHGFAFAPERLRVAVNDALVGWDHALADGDEVVFLPPVSGG